MAQRVVDLPEAVQVETKHRDAGPLTVGAGQRRLELVREGPAIVKAREAVVPGQVGDLGLGLAAVATLAAGSAHAGEAFMGVYQHDIADHISIGHFEHGKEIVFGFR